MMNQKGQAFSVFKLLIAAVIAIAILGILVPILNSIINIGQNNPAEEAIREIKASFNSLGNHNRTDAVTFEPEATFRAATIADGSGVISQGQICISAGDFTDDQRFQEISAGQSLLYQASGNQRAELSIICDKGNQIRADIEEVEDFFGLKSEWFDNSCGDLSACDESSAQTCCFIAVRAT